MVAGKLIVSEKESPNGLLLVITDANILGKSFEEGKLQLDLSKEFYKGIERNKEWIKKMSQKAQYFHLTGKEAIALGVEFGLVKVDKILYIKKVPHAQVVIGG
ncbi:DUF424 family protein [Candidatus Woesearchaeota archaeon]|nr:DUF424 family protein [Candidatus Woesearchaeota archaeon]